MSRRLSWVYVFFVWMALAAGGEAEVSFSVDCAEGRGQIRALHGGNCGPIQFGGLLDLTAALRALHMPYTRLHDCHWPAADVVDIHTIFPNFEADASKPENFDFRRTDEYLQSVTDMDSKIIYRLGESIEHTKTKYYVHPPKDNTKWAEICLGIIAHCNEGWGGGPKRGITYWEIWNEPENRPAMWTGTDEGYFQLYETAAKAIKKRWPELKVGGPSVGYTGKIQKGQFVPGEFVVKFLAYCKARSVPLDFFSWHLYTTDASECVVRAKGIRAALDAQGFTTAESHFNEWNYLPRNDWSPLSIRGQGAARERFFEELGGVQGGVFAAGVLLNLQDAPVDVANYYSNANDGFGMFSAHGVPRKAYHAFTAFGMLLQTPERVAAEGSAGGTRAICAGLNREKTVLGVLIASSAGGRGATLTVKNLPWKEAASYEIFLMDATRNWERVRTGILADGVLDVSAEFVKGPGVLGVRIRK